MNRKERVFTIPSPCRLCLEDSRFKLPIFGETAREMRIHFKIQSCLPTVSVLKDDGLPEEICYKCINSLERMYEFWSKCCTTEAILSNKIAKGKFLTQSCRQVIHARRAICYQPTEKTAISVSSDDSENEWCTWDATYKITDSHDNNTSQVVPMKDEGNIRINNDELFEQENNHSFNTISKISQIDDTNTKSITGQKRKASFDDNSQKTCDLLQDEFYYKNKISPKFQKNNLDETSKPSSSALSTNYNFSANFWKQNSRNSCLTVKQTSTFDDSERKCMDKENASVLNSTIHSNTDGFQNQSKYDMHVNNICKTPVSNHNQSLVYLQPEDTEKLKKPQSPDQKTALLNSNQNYSHMYYTRNAANCNKDDSLVTQNMQQKYNENILKNTRSLLERFRAFNNTNS